jgi:hypothetical protein
MLVRERRAGGAQGVEPVVLATQPPFGAACARDHERHDDNQPRDAP